MRFVLKIEAAFSSDTSVLYWAYTASIAKYRNSNSYRHVNLKIHILHIDFIE